jgi:hypothetical protein
MLMGTVIHRSRIASATAKIAAAVHHTRRALSLVIVSEQRLSIHQHATR